jgi:hypothetical protein
MFWNIRKERKVNNHKSVMSIGEKIVTAYRVFNIHGFKGVIKAFENEKYFFKTVLRGELGYALFKGIKNPDR